MEASRAPSEVVRVQYVRLGGDLKRWTSTTPRTLHRERPRAVQKKAQTPGWGCFHATKNRWREKSAMLSGRKKGKEKGRGRKERRERERERAPGKWRREAIQRRKNNYPLWARRCLLKRQKALVGGASRRSGSCGSFHPRSFHHHPPDICSVASSRLIYSGAPSSLPHPSLHSLVLVSRNWLPGLFRVGDRVGHFLC